MDVGHFSQYHTLGLSGQKNVLLGTGGRSSALLLLDTMLGQHWNPVPQKTIIFKLCKPMHLFGVFGPSQPWLKWDHQGSFSKNVNA